MSEGVLQHIQVLQFEHKDEAEKLLKSFLQDVYSDQVENVELRPLAVSLNSFNGYLTLKGGKRLFFKTHTEPDTVITEYYNAGRLADAGYPVIRPVFSSTDVGKQLLIYEIINDVSVFDVAWSIECGDNSQFARLAEAQERSDKQLFDLYIRSLAEQSSIEAERAPIHQLFYHRIAGGRLERFYGQQPSGDYAQIKLIDNIYPLDKIRQMRWIINGQHFNETIEEIIQRAQSLLNPRTSGISVVGHGDAHNGNVFFQSNATPPSLLYFDPAFAGRHSPLLDLTKPLFHNVFAMWMYFPLIKRDNLHISLDQSDDTFIIQHDYALHPVREMFLKSKLHHVVIPLFQKLKMDAALPSNWREYLKSALFCCPFLTMNLADSRKFPSEISLLGLAISVEMGAESKRNRSLIDTALDFVAAQID